MFEAVITPTGTWYADNFSKSFFKRSEKYIRIWKRLKNGQHGLRFQVKNYEYTKTGQILEKPESKEERICMEVLRDTKNHSRLLLKTNQTEAYQLGSSAIPTLESRARISGAKRPFSSVQPTNTVWKS